MWARIEEKKYIKDIRKTNTSSDLQYLHQRLQTLSKAVTLKRDEWEAVKTRTALLKSSVVGTLSEVTQKYTQNYKKLSQNDLQKYVTDLQNLKSHLKSSEKSKFSVENLHRSVQKRNDTLVCLFR